uniref:Mitochondrial import inner membrane translocase subunit n=1 Tax=Arcella intermedia TaxID=1963864 RepID=A0A6B2LVA7_9EUKA
MSKDVRKRELERFRFDITDYCFDFCVNNFRTREFDHVEAVCINHCTEKYIAHHLRVSRTYSDQLLLKEEKQRELLSKVL